MQQEYDSRITQAQYAQQRYAEQQLMAQQRRQAQQMTFLKLGLGCTGLGMLLFAGITLLVLIVTPIWFRGLPTSEQVIWTNRIPLLEAFRPTRVYSAEALPTSANGSDDAFMLLTPIASPIAGQASGTLEAGGTGSELSGVNPALMPTQHLPLVPPGMRPTSILATNTPVIASIGATPTPVPTQLAVLPTATATATIPPTAIPTEIPAPVSFQAVGYNFVKQTWNTCGPANLTQVLNYMGWSGTKDQVIDYLKPSTEDRNVSPWEMVNYVNEHLNKERGMPMRALMRVGGNLNLVKRLVANKFGVILEKGYFVAGEGWMGHYLTIEGYDDTTGTFNVLDTYLGRRAEKYQDVDSRWQQFNRIFIVVYSQEREAELARLMGGHQDVAYAINYALSKAKEEASTQPDNPYAWFNLGSNFTLLRDYQNAVRAFDKALNVGAGLPWRMLWYQFTMYEAYYNAGQYQQLKSLTEVTLGTSPDLEESHYWRGMALAALGETEAAQNAFRRALNINPRFTPATDRLEELRNGTFRPPV